MPLKSFDLSRIAQSIKQTYALQYSMMGLYIATQKPQDALAFKKEGSGCSMPLILASAG